MKLRHFGWLTAMLMTILLGACASAKIVNTTEAKLMPDSVAKTVLSKYFGKDWASNPYMNKHLIWCGNERVSIKFSEAKAVSFYSIGKKVVLEWGVPNPLMLPRCDGAIRGVDAQSESEATEITNALISLGAPIRGFVSRY